MAVYVSRKRKVEDSVDSDIDKKQGSWLILIVTEKCRSRAFHSWSDLSVSDFFSDVNWYNSHRFNKHVLKNQKISLSLPLSLRWCVSKELRAYGFVSTFRKFKENCFLSLQCVVFFRCVSFYFITCCCKGCFVCVCNCLFEAACSLWNRVHKADSQTCD